jgi:hypothetical protein
VTFASIAVQSREPNAIAQTPAAAVPPTGAPPLASSSSYETQVGYGAAVIIPELQDWRTVAPFLANWWLATNPESSAGERLHIAVNRTVPPELQTKSRIDFREWILTLLTEGSGNFCAVSKLGEEEIQFSQVTSNIYVRIPDLVLEAEVACYDEETLTLQKGFRMDLLVGPDKMQVNPSLRTGITRNTSVLVVTARAKWFRDGVYADGGSAIVGATIVERADTLDLGLFLRGSGIGIGHNVKVKPGLQTTILRCGSRAVTLALARALRAPYWRVLPEFPEDDIARNSLQRYLAGLTPEVAAQIPARIQWVLANPFMESVQFQRQEVQLAMQQLGPGKDPEKMPRKMPYIQPDHVLIRFVGFPEFQRIQISSCVQDQMATCLVRHAGDWFYTSRPKGNFANPETRRKWATRIVNHMTKTTGKPCQVVEITAARFDIVNASSY